ncbi:class I lanthipeptide [Saccharicrinis fermentans]|uniref:Uncharacterized protein n=1 Tax=Saccharicrinis fermentans DSM 9555 = JCM 21142 TaxID=869213 RepID=W7YMI9_9BACT|nr:class I lanthipeptide [Saccharicrinis fermentans]GAF05886.1 hypothetical protein JCM21142_114645 [Saccharicrinis fermentans DSM 9555 = JCM 21142]
MKKLNLNKETIAVLDNSAMSEVKGGFTYSLSTGLRCKVSKAHGGGNPYECGEMLAKEVAAAERVDELKKLE